MISAVKQNSKIFFKYSKQTNKKKPGIGSLRNESGDLESDPKAISEILRKQYDKVFNTKNAENEITLDPNNNDDNKTFISDYFVSNDESTPFNMITVSEGDIRKAIEETKINSAPGIDGFPPVFLHKVKEQLLKPLHKIFNKSLKSGEIPEIWKQAIITPIFKSGKKDLPCNYRPVSLTSVIAKLLERIIRWYLVIFLEINNAFPDSQHGFRQFRSTVSQLLEHVEAIVDALEDQANIDIIMLDYSKAFDRISISILLEKL